MARPTLAYRDRAVLPKLGEAAPAGPLLLDTNVFINAFAGRGPPVLRAVLLAPSRAFMSGPTFAELRWTLGRLDPAHPDTAAMVVKLEETLGRIAPARRLAPTMHQWAQAGELAGRAVRGLAGATRSITTPLDRAELINDALTALVARAAGATVITQDADFDLFAQLDPSLRAVFYD